MARRGILESPVPAEAWLDAQNHSGCRENLGTSLVLEHSMVYALEPWPHTLLFLSPARKHLEPS